MTVADLSGPTQPGLAEYQSWMARNGHYRCTCGEKLADHYADLKACATNIECPGFTLDRDPLVNRINDESAPRP